MLAKLAREEVDEESCWLDDEVRVRASTTTLQAMES